MSEVKLAAPVRAELVPDIDAENVPPGAFGYWVEKDGTKERGMIYCCPCGCKRLGALPFHPKSEDDIKHNRAAWVWDGNREAPTLLPSINNVGHWHGWLSAGYFVQA